MTHVFVAPHPDDVALSCGGLIASLRELGQNVAILTLYSGSGGSDDLSDYQREALGFGSKSIWPVTEAFNRAHLEADYPLDDPGAIPPWQATKGSLDATQSEADAAAKRFWQRSSWYRRAAIHNESLAGQPIIDDVSAQGAVLTTERTEAADAGDLMATRRLEDERYAAFAEISMVWLDLPDAVFRGYEGDDELLGAPRDDDPAPVDALRRELARLEPQRVYVPLGIGGHVDHQLTRNAGIALLHDARRWVMPGVDWTGQLVFYEDFPYAWWEEFRRLEDLPDGSLDGLPADVSLTAEFADIGDQLERKITGIDLYQSQIERLFTGQRAMAQAVRGFGAEGGGPRARPGWRGRALLGDHPFLIRSAARRAERPAAAARPGVRGALELDRLAAARDPRPVLRRASSCACGCCQRAASSATSTSSSCGSTGSPSTAGTAPTTRTSASPPSWRGSGGRSRPSSPRSRRSPTRPIPGSGR